jgi:phosphomannomutase/phosphoglucomutase
MRARYIASLTDRPPFSRRFRVVVATGNGTAGAFAPEVLQRLGVEIIPLHTALDHRFPNYNPNPEDMAMLDDIARVVKAEGADIGFGFDGDGDRCGIVGDDGRAIFADRAGLLLARDLAARYPGSRFVVDVKSTCLFADDAVLKAHGATTDYFKTGHSYIKRRVQDLKALAGFEKSGHFFFNEPLGRGYDDGLMSAIAIIDMLDRAPGRSIADLHRDLPRSWASPTMSANCGDQVKYDVVARLTARIAEMPEIGGDRIIERNTVNGIRVTVADGTWGLVRASSNKPELVVVIESPVSEARQRQMFASLDALLRESPEVGVYNQTF